LPTKQVPDLLERLVDVEIVLRLGEAEIDRGTGANVLGSPLLALARLLLTEPKSHSAVFGSADAAKAGLPVKELDPALDRWHEVWRLWARYAVLGNQAVFEGRRASHVFGLG
jgi:hypothetical protein